MAHIWETSGEKTIDEQIAAAAAKVIYDRMSDEEKAAIGTEGWFGEFSVEDIAREAVRKAVLDGMRYKYGSHAYMIFGAGL